jgi:hypothetical protein
LFTVVPDADAQPALDFVRGVRDRTGVAAATKIFVADVEEG